MAFFYRIIERVWLICLFLGEFSQRSDDMMSIFRSLYERKRKIIEILLFFDKL